MTDVDPRYVNTEAAQLAKPRPPLTDQVADLTRRLEGLEAYLREFSQQVSRELGI
jgi:hypothetical protein